MAVGYRMSTGEGEQLHLWLLFAFAMEHRAPVKVSFFETIKDLARQACHVEWP